MFKLLGKIGCLLAIISLIDGVGILFQCYAWATMLQDRIPNQGIEKALQSTFSGEAPCPKCLAVKKAQEDKKKHECPAPQVADSSLVAKYIPNRLERISLNLPESQRSLLSQERVTRPAKIYLSADVPPPDLS